MEPRTSLVAYYLRLASAPATLPATPALAAWTLLAQSKPAPGRAIRTCLDTGSKTRTVSHLRPPQEVILQTPAMFAPAVRRLPQVLGVSQDAISSEILAATRCAGRGFSTPICPCSRTLPSAKEPRLNSNS